MSRPIIIDIPHQLGVDEAKRRVDQGFAQLIAQIGGSGLAQVTKSWMGDRLTFSLGMLGQLTAGQLLVMNDKVRMELTLPGILGAFAGAVRARVQTQAQRLLGNR